MATINGMYVLAEAEDPRYEVDATDQPVEDGVSLTDHVQIKPTIMDVTGYIVGDDAAQIRENIKTLLKSGEIVTFQGRNIFTGLIISFSSNHTYKVANGFPFSLSLKEIRIAKSSFVESLPTPIKAAAAPVISSGRKQMKQKPGKLTEGTTVDRNKLLEGSPWVDE